MNSCNPSTTELATTGSVYIVCPNFNRNAVFANATTLTFSGDIDGGGRTIPAPLARRIVVRGGFSVNGSGGTFSAPRVEEFYLRTELSTSNGYQLLVNSTSATSCTGGGSTLTKLVVFGTSPTVLRWPTTLCSTFAYLAGHPRARTPAM